MRSLVHPLYVPKGLFTERVHPQFPMLSSPSPSLLEEVCYTTLSPFSLSSPLKGELFVRW